MVEKGQEQANKGLDKKELSKIFFTLNVKNIFHVKNILHFVWFNL